MKKVLSILLSVLMLISVFTVPGMSVTAAETSAVSTADVIESTVTYNLDTETGVLTISGTGAMTDYTSTSAVPWYSSRTSVTSIVIEEGVTSIGSYSFQNCTNLTSVTIPSTVTAIGTRAFYGCKLLATVTLPNALTTLGERVFQNCSALAEINIPDTLTSIGSYSFSSCSKLAKVHVNSIEHYLNITFGNNTASPLNNKGILYVNNEALAELVVPETVKSINDYAFYNYTGLTSVTIPSTVTNIGASAFYGCTDLTGIAIPDGVTSIGEKAFYGCTNVASISLADTVKSIGADAFTNTSYYSTTANWTSNILYIGNQLISAKTTLSGAITIKSGTVSIAGKAFNSCSKITSVTIPSSVKSMGSKAFAGCSAITAIYIDDLANWCNISFATVDSTPLCKAKTKNLYLNNSLITSLTIPEEVTSIGDFAFAYCQKITNVTIPDTVTSIGQYAFAYDTALKTINFPEGLTDIGQYAFNGCTALTSVTFPDTLKNVASYAFASCSAITSVNVNSIDTWCNITFGNNSANPASITKTLYVNNEAITEVVVPEGVIAISSNAFYGMETLTSVTIPSTVESIGTFAFFGCTTLTDVTIAEGTKLIDGYAFKNCSALKSIVLPASVETIEYDAFYGCSSLESLAIYNPEITIFDNSNTIPDNTVIYGHMGSNAQAYANAFSKEFKDINTLKYSYEILDDGSAVITGYHGNETNVFIPFSIGGYIVTGIGENAFDGCTNVQSITISDAITSIESSAFNNCTSLDAVYVSSLENWLNITFGNNTANPLYYAGNLYVAGELLEALTTDETMTSINAFAFAGCTSLTSVKLCEYTESIGESAFEACLNLETFAVYNPEINIYDTSNTISDTAVMYGHMNSNAQAYANAFGRTFKDLSNLNYSYTEIDDGLAVITGYFGNDEVVNIPYAIDGYIVYGIDEKVFYGCTNLKSVRIPDSVTTIGAKAFENCTNLETVTLGDSLLTIENSAFYGCTSLKSVYINNMPTWCHIDFKTLTSNPLYYADNLYLNDELVTDLVIPENTTKIGDYAFWNYSKITSITIPDTVTEIGKYAFYKCSSIESVYISSLENWCNITFDNYYANPLYYASNLYVNGEVVTDLIIPENVTAIGDYAFINCPALTSVTISNTVTSIGQDVFYGCTSLSTVNADSIESWCNITFENSTANPLYYSGALYVNNEAVTEVKIPSTVTAINDYTFIHLTSLISITIPNTVTSIGDYAFHGLTPVVNGYTDSAAEKFAIANSLTFVAFGDVNGDGEVSINDVTAIQKHLAKLTQLDDSQLVKADVNGDNKLSIRDATYIQMYITKLIDSFPESV